MVIKSLNYFIRMNKANAEYLSSNFKENHQSKITRKTTVTYKEYYQQKELFTMEISTFLN